LREVWRSNGEVVFGISGDDMITDVLQWIIYKEFEKNIGRNQVPIFSAKTSPEFWAMDLSFSLDLIGGIEEEEYENFLKDHDKYLADIDNFYSGYPELVEKHVLKRFQDKDLGLLINYSWHNEANRKEYERRLKGVSNE